MEKQRVCDKCGSALSLCNKCGAVLDCWDKQENFSIKRIFGYGTKFDGDRLNLHLCCGCMEKLIDECVISPVEDD